MYYQIPTTDNNSRLYCNSDHSDKELKDLGRVGVN